MTDQPYDLRKVIEELKTLPGQYHETDIEIDPEAELSGVYRYIGAGGTVKRPTQEGPAMTFNNIKGFPGTRVNIGTMASRKRVGEILHHDYRTLGRFLKDAVENPIKPVKVDKADAPAQEVVHLATDADFDIRNILPAPTNTPEDAGPYITMGVVLGSDPEKTMSDVTIHRMVLEDKDTIGMYIMPGGRHIGHFQKQFEALNKPMPITINIGLDPAIAIGTTFEPPTTPLGYNELWCAGALRNEPIQIVDGIAVDEVGIARAEFIIEAEIMPNETMQEDINTNSGKAMPEFPGYTGDANPAVQVVKVKAVTHRKDNPIMQTTIGPSEEHVSMAGIPTEASILALSAFKELKTVILVDEDVDIFDMNDVVWTFNTRFQGDKDIIVIPGMRNHPLDPSELPEYNPGSIRFRGISAKTIFDGTVPFDMKEHFVRAKFQEVEDWEKYLK